MDTISNPYGLMNLWEQGDWVTRFVALNFFCRKTDCFFCCFCCFRCQSVWRLAVRNVLAEPLGSVLADFGLAPLLWKQPMRKPVAASGESVEPPRLVSVEWA